MHFRTYMRLSVAIALAAATPALAHHTGSAIDFSREVKLEGTVKDWQYTNPHSWLDVVVTYPNGQSQTWAFETGSISSIIRHGWTSKSVIPGEKVTVLAFPLRSGATGGRLASVTKADGTVVGESLAGDRN